MDVVGRESAALLGPVGVAARALAHPHLLQHREDGPLVLHATSLSEDRPPLCNSISNERHSVYT